MTEIRLFLFGNPRFELDGQPIDLSLRKAQALIAYLAVTGQTQSRDFLAGLLWPESDQSSARGNLRRTLYRIKQELGDEFLEISRDSLGLSAGTDLGLDVRQFRAKMSACPQAEPPGPDCLQAWEAGAALYAADFMAGFSLPDSAAFEEWQFFEREDLRRTLAQGLQRLARAYLDRGSPKEAIAYARRWLALDQLHEPAQRLLMELYARSGQPAAALRQYQECRRLLDEALKIAPQPATVELYETIRAGNIPPASQPAFTVPEIHYVPSGDVHIAYQTLGDGPVDVLIVPGFVSHLEVIWESPSLARTMRQFARVSRLILFDKRGVGLSDRVGYPPTLEHTMDDILAVLDAVGSERAVLFGFSEGGPNSLVFTAAHPERVLGLILYGTLAKGLQSDDYPWALTEEQHKKWLDWLVSVWGKPVPHAYFAPSHADDQALWDWFAKLLRLGSSPGGVQGVLNVLKDIDVRQILSSIHVPTLVIHRTGDQVMRLPAGRYLAEHIPGARFIELPGDDHWWWLGDVPAVMEPVARFLAELKSLPASDRSLATILCLRTPGGADSARGGFVRLESKIGAEIERFHGRRRQDARQILLATFDRPSRAIGCALALHQLGLGQGINLPITLHTGECIVVGEQLGGQALEIGKAALRVAGQGGVVVSRTVKDLVVGAGFSFERAGAIRYGNERWEFFKVA